MRKSRWVAVLTAVVLAFGGQLAAAADHIDGPQAAADPAADITDAFAWMTPDASKVILVMDLTRNADVGSKFSDSVQYVFHTTSSASFGATASADVPVICQFDPQQRVECWAGDAAYVTGDASSLSGISSSNGRLRVFTGLRNDPFFFNLQGLRNAVAGIKAAAAGLTFTNGCPNNLTDVQVGGLVATLAAQQPADAAAVPPCSATVKDCFAGFNVMALVVQVDKTLVVNGTDTFLSVWASTHAAP